MVSYKALNTKTKNYRNISTAAGGISNKSKKPTTPNHALQHGWALSVMRFILAFFSKKGFVQWWFKS